MPVLKELKLPILVLVRGLPGSGKSYLTQALQKAISEELGQDTVVVLDPDATDYESTEYKELATQLASDGVEAKFHPYRFLRGRAHAGIAANKVIIWNQPFTQFDGFNKTVVNLQAYATEHGKELPLLVVEVEINHEIAKDRVDKRKSAGGHGPSDNTFDRFKSEYESFANRGFNTVQVQGEDDVAVTVPAVVVALENLRI